MVEKTKLLEKYLHEHIPLSSFMGVRVKRASEDEVTLDAPFLPNVNHKMTVFGGSLHALTTLACWSFLHLRLISLGFHDAQIVIAKSEVDFLAPVNKDFSAVCLSPPEDEWARFLKILVKRGKARLELQGRVFEDQKLCVNFLGSFVAIKRSKS